MVCRICYKKGDYWILKCFYKDLVVLVDVFVDKLFIGELFVVFVVFGFGKVFYVLFSMRFGADRSVVGSDMRRRNDENFVCVINLFEDICEFDLMEFFYLFGVVMCVYVVID